MPVKRKTNSNKNEANKALFDVRAFNANESIDEYSNKKLDYRGKSYAPSAKLVGIKVPFPIQYLLDAEVLQLGIVIEVDGEAESCKTMFMYENAKWIMDAGGWSEMVLTESKISIDLQKSIMGYHKVADLSFKYEEADDLEHMQKLTLAAIENAKDKVNMNNPTTGKPVGTAFPFMVGIDSIMGTNSVESNKKIDDSGSAGRSFPIEALQLNKFMKKVASSLQTFPFNLLLINHRKVAKKDESNPYKPREFSKAGGKAIQFQETYEFILEGKKRSSRPDLLPNGGFEVHERIIHIRNGKNSSGTNFREIDVRVSWRDIEMDIPQPDGTTRKELKQVTQWHWNEATTYLLWAYFQKKHKTQKEDKAHRAKFSQVLHIGRVTKPREGFWSKHLGMTAEDAVNATKFGKMINENPDIIDALRRRLGFATGIEWSVGKGDYRKIRRELDRESAKLAKSRADEDKAQYMVDLDELEEQEMSA